MKACRDWLDAAYLRGSRCAPFIIVLYLKLRGRYTNLVKISLLRCINYVKYFKQHSFHACLLPTLKEGKYFQNAASCPQVPFLYVLKPCAPFLLVYP